MYVDPETLRRGAILSSRVKIEEKKKKAADQRVDLTV